MRGGQEAVTAHWRNRYTARWVAYIGALLVVVSAQFGRASAVQLVAGDIIAPHQYTGDILLVAPETGAQTVIASTSAYPVSAIVEPIGTVLIGFTSSFLDGSQLRRLDPSDGSLSDPLPHGVGFDAWALAFDSAGKLLIGSNNSPAIRRVDLSTGGIAIVSAAGHLVQPGRLAVEPSGSIVVVADIWADPGTIVRIDPTTGSQTVLSSAEHLREVRGIAVTPDGNIYATSRGPSWEGLVVRIDPGTGNQTILSSGGLLSDLTALTADASGSLFVGSGGGLGSPVDAIVRLDPTTGDQVAVSVGTYSSPPFWGLAVAPGFSCPAAPSASCATASKSLVKMKASTNGSGGKFLWKWIRGTAAVADFGAPETDTEFALCAYLDGQRIVDAPIRAGGTCGGRPCWRTTGSVGFAYRNRDGNVAGLTKVKLRAGSNKAQLQIAGGRDNLVLPAQPLELNSSLRLQLIRSGDSTCWESNFPTFNRNSEKIFKAVATAP